MRRYYALTNHSPAPTIFQAHSPALTIFQAHFLAILTPLLCSRIPTQGSSALHCYTDAVTMLSPKHTPAHHQIQSFRQLLHSALSAHQLDTLPMP
eukprot:113173-Amorphochlora_amoeboformis.AAC.1